MFDGGETVDKERAKRTINEVAGHARREVGEWTRDTNAQTGGLAQEMKGRAQKASDDVKDATCTAKGKFGEELQKNNAK